MKWTKERIREFRESLAVSQSTFAALIGVSRTATVSDWETGKAVPSSLAERLLNQLENEVSHVER